MQLCDPVIVAPEKRQEILSQIIFVEFGQRPDYAKVQRNILPQRFRLVRNIDIARVHVGMEEAVGKDLHEEDLDTFAPELARIDNRGAQAGDLAEVRKSG